MNLSGTFNTNRMQSSVKVKIRNRVVKLFFMNLQYLKLSGENITVKEAKRNETRKIPIKGFAPINFFEPISHPIKKFVGNSFFIGLNSWIICNNKEKHRPFTDEYKNCALIFILNSINKSVLEYNY